MQINNPSDNREKAITAMIETWLQSPLITCASCGKVLLEAEMCCSNPQPMTNKEILSETAKVNQANKETRANVYGSTKDKSQRWLLSLPPGLYHFLNNTFKKRYNETLFNEKYDGLWFAKRFRRIFTVAEVI